MINFKRIVKRFSITVLVWPAAISGCGLSSDADQKLYFGDTRQPDEMEYQYQALASEIHSIKPCYLIHPDSLRKAAFNSVGNQVTLVRSECFRMVAEVTGDAQICEKVRSASTLFLSGANSSAELCRRLAGRGNGISYDLDVQQFVELASYSEEEVDAYLVTEGRFSSVEAATRYRQERPSTYWGEVRRTLLHSREFFERIARFPGFAAAEDQAAMAALDWKPRQQRQWIPPEHRSRSAPEIRMRANPGK